MKKPLLWLLIMLLTVSMIATFSLAGCKKEKAPVAVEAEEEAVAPAAEEVAEEEVAPAEEELAESKGLLYYLATDMLNGFNIGSAKNAEKFGEELGYDARVLDANASPDAQINQVETAMTMKPEVIMIKAVESQTIAESLREAKEAGIIVIAYDNTITEVKLDITSVLSCVKVGELAGEECVKMLDDKYGEAKGKLLQVMGDLGDMYSVLINEGFMNVMDGNPNIEVITKDSPGWQGQANIVADQLVANKDIDIIFVHADSMIPSVVPVLEGNDYQKGDIKLIGTDGDPSALELIRDGWMEVSIGVPMVQQCWGMFEFLDEIIAGEEIKEGSYDIKGVAADLVQEEWGPTLYLPGEIITKDNVDDPGLWGNIPIE